MRESMRLPRRLAENMRAKEMVKEYLPAMATIVEHHRGVRMQEVGGHERTLKGCVQVQVWTEADGRECIVVCGTDNVSHLELKGMLHDGVYALAHEGEPGYVA